MLPFFLSETAERSLPLVLVSLSLALAAQLRKRGVDPELTRKTAHFGTCLALLPLPSLVHSRWTALLLALAARDLEREAGRVHDLDAVDDEPAGRDEIKPPPPPQSNLAVRGPSSERIAPGFACDPAKPVLTTLQP